MGCRPRAPELRRWSRPEPIRAGGCASDGLPTIGDVHAASLPELAPLALMLLLLELAVGTTAAAYLVDLAARVGRGFVGTTAAICAVVMGLEVVIAVLIPGGVRLLNGPLSADALSSLVHWSIGLTGALALYAFFCAVGTDAARRVIGALTIGVGAVAMGTAVVAFGPALGGISPVVLAFIPASLLAGSTLAGMLLGHWYLVAPRLSFRPLRRAID